ncbi:MULTISPECIES: hypothetical protein [Microbacterium]|uniref:hypothetical protein n=1 Tax=Microbacterium TaxID=33882 RepID=UPI001BB17817|nr:hypothetical protein [Microbacterium sp. 4NA327F11]
MKVIVREDAAAEVLRLRAQLDRMQGRSLDAPILPTHSALAGLLPGGGLRAGAAYALGPSTSLLLSLLAAPSQTGSWCAVVGVPELGAEAASDLGVDLSRLVLVPDPGPRWLAVAATLADVLPVVAVRPIGRVSDADASRFGARLRERNAVLLVQGVWPQAAASIGLESPEWSGLGAGDGYLRSRALTVSVQTRQAGVPRRARLLLPDPAGALAGIAPERAVAAPDGVVAEREPAAVPLLRAVG